MADSRELDVVLYGATGYTGRLVAEELDARGARFAIAGRDARKLSTLASRLKSRPPTFAVPLEDAEGLARLAGRGRVMLSAAGPFVRMGTPVLNGALEAGSHYADITGEQPYLRRVLERDEEARARDVAVVSAIGFDVVPSDFAAALAAQGLGPLDSLDLAIHSRSGISGGTRRSMAASADQGWWWDRGELRPAGVGRFGRAFDFPAPLGRLQGVFVPWGDVITAPRSVGARTVRTFFTFPAGRAMALRLGWPLIAAAPRWGWVRRRMERDAQSAPEGPSPEARRRADFAILAEAVAADGRVQRSLVTGLDPYGLTGATAAHGAMLLARGAVRGRGVLTPSQAFDVDAFGKALGGFSLRMQTLAAAPA